MNNSIKPKKMEIKITKKIEREMIDDVFVAAIEGGSNYWFSIEDDTIKRVRKVVPRNKQPHISLAIAEAVIDHGIDIKVYDNELSDNDEPVGIISRGTIAERLQLLSEHANYGWALHNMMQGDCDANCADVIFQYIAIGSVEFG